MSSRFRWLVLVTAAAATLAATGADAQSRRRGAYRAEPDAYAAPAPAYGRYGRGADIYSRPAGSDGIIRWNTPHADGNLGSSSTGGGGGGGP